MVFAAFPPPRSPFHLSEHHEFSDLEGVRVTIGVKLAGKVDRGWLGRRGGQARYPCVPVARGDRCHDASGDRLPPSHSYLPASTRLKCADDEAVIIVIVIGNMKTDYTH